MKKSRSWVLLLVIGLLTACVSIPELTHDEYKSVTNREYTGVTREQVLQAGEELFRLADGDDFMFRHSRNDSTSETLFATRGWSEYIVISATRGIDYWKLDVISTEKGAKATILLNRRILSQANLGNPEGAHFDPIPVNQWPTSRGIANTSIYDLYWGRMDYLLGKRADWMTCKMSDDRISKKIVWGNNDFLCNMLNMKDNSPTSPIVISTQ